MQFEADHLRAQADRFARLYAALTPTQKAAADRAIVW